MMKFTLLSIAVILFVSVASAQITKGSVYLGGSVGGSTTKIENNNTAADGRSSGFSLYPAVGIATRNNLITGISLNYTHGKTENITGNQNGRRNGFGVGVFLRKYYPLSDRIYVFTETNLSYFHQKWEYLPPPGYNNTQVNQQNVVSVGVFPGLAIHVIKSFYLETAFNNLLQISYSSSNATTSYAGTTSSVKQKDFSVQSSLTNGSYLNIGVRFIIPKK